MKADELAVKHSDIVAGVDRLIEAITAYNRVVLEAQAKMDDLSSEVANRLNELYDMGAWFNGRRPQGRSWDQLMWPMTGHMIVPETITLPSVTVPVDVLGTIHAH